MSRSGDLHISNAAMVPGSGRLHGFYVALKLPTGQSDLETIQVHLMWQEGNFVVRMYICFDARKVR